MTLGEVAGTAAWLAIRRGTTVAQLAQEPRAVAELQRVLHCAGFRTLAPTSMAVHVGLQDAQPAQLLRRGLFNTPTYRRGSLDSAQPILARDFVANLEHWLSAHGKWSTRSAALLARCRWTNRDSEAPLSWAGARAVFILLQEDPWEVLKTPRRLTRAQAAHLLINMFRAAERQVAREPRFPGWHRQTHAATLLHWKRGSVRTRTFRISVTSSASAPCR
ncbi:hypothetical protein [Deinococcus ruber]|nr:hypothetical protein [Deinococcus ruber]